MADLGRTGSRRRCCAYPARWGRAWYNACCRWDQSNCPRGPRGWSPYLPRAGSVLSHAFLSPLAFVSGAESLLADFIEAFFPLAADVGAEFLTLALPATDARLPALRRRFSTRTWRSRLYRVDWPGQAAMELGGGAVFLPDVALL